MEKGREKLFVLVFPVCHCYETALEETNREHVYFIIREGFKRNKETVDGLKRIYLCLWI